MRCPVRRDFSKVAQIGTLCNTAEIREIIEFYNYRREIINPYNFRKPDL